LRYIDIETITFIDQNGNRYPVKDIRIIPTYAHIFTIKKQPNNDIDEIATRPDVYGPLTEGDSFKIWDHNIVKFAEARYDVMEITEVRIPL